jgi:hypothetical protein
MSYTCTLVMHTELSCYTLVITYQSILRHMPEDCDLESKVRENIRHVEIYLSVVYVAALSVTESV